MAPAVLEKYRTEFVAPECFFAPHMSFAELLSGILFVCVPILGLSRISVSLTLGRAGFLFFFLSAILSLKDHDADCYPKIRLVSSETAHPGYLKNLVAARWNIFQLLSL